MNKKYIGIFDSGLGGLTTVSEVISKLPEENIVFLADTKHLPYGSKSKEEIISYTLNNIAYLRQYGLKAVVIACNTSDSNASQSAREVYDLPIFGVIAPAAKKAAETTENKKVGILATESTIRSGRYEQLIAEHDPMIKTYPMACPKLVPLIEEGTFKNDVETLKEALNEYLSPLLEEGIDTLILGCTHYDILTDLIRELCPDLKLISSSRCVVQDLEEYLEKQDLKEEGDEGKRIYLSTSDPENFTKTASYLIEGIRIEAAK